MQKMSDEDFKILFSKLKNFEDHEGVTWQAIEKQLTPPQNAKPRPLVYLGIILLSLLPIVYWAMPEFEISHDQEPSTKGNLLRDQPADLITKTPTSPKNLNSSITTLSKSTIEDNPIVISAIENTVHKTVERENQPSPFSLADDDSKIKKLELISIKRLEFDSNKIGIRNLGNDSAIQKFTHDSKWSINIQPNVNFAYIVPSYDPISIMSLERTPIYHRLGINVRVLRNIKVNSNVNFFMGFTLNHHTRNFTYYYRTAFPEIKEKIQRTERIDFTSIGLSTSFIPYKRISLLADLNFHLKRGSFIGSRSITISASSIFSLKNPRYSIRPIMSASFGLKWKSPELQYFPYSFGIVICRDY